MTNEYSVGKTWLVLIAVLLAIAAVALAACSSLEELPAADPLNTSSEPISPTYKIGPSDTLHIFVWQQEDLSGDVAVRPDGQITMPLIEDMHAVGKTPTELARDIETALSTYIHNPSVTVMAGGFTGTYDQQIRVVGEAQEPAAIPYRANATLLDVMIAVGGLTEFADGNRARLIRVQNNKRKTYRVRLNDLIREGDISANAAVLPGDVIIIPTSVF